MSLTESQLQFAAEFLTLIVSASLLALVMLHPDLRPASDRAGRLPPGTGTRGALAAVALIVTGGAAFVHGSLLVTGPHAEWVGLARAAAAAVLAAAFPFEGALGESRSHVGGAMMMTGFLAWVAAGVNEAAGGSAYVMDGLLIGGSVAIAAAVLRVARRSIAARVAANGAVTLLLVVMALALALSAVISSKLQSEELSRLSSRASVEQQAATESSAVSLAAQQLEALLSESFPVSAANPLTRFAGGTPDQRSAAATSILQRLDQLPRGPGSTTLAYADPTGQRVLVSGPSPASGAGFGRQPDLRASSCSSGHQGLYEIGGGLYVAADTPVCTSDGDRLGVAIAATPLDGVYLARRSAIDPGVALALVSESHVFAAVGITDAVAVSEAGRFRAVSGQSVTQSVGGRYAGVAPLSVSADTGTRLQVDLLLSDRSDTLMSTRDQLFRTLFLIAFGGTILAFGLAIFTGDRITAGLRRLTRASAGIAAGDVSLRSRVEGDDEVATLGAAFDAMVDSVTAQSAALQHAADDEARLRNQLQAVVAGMNDALVAIDAEGRITEFNQAAVALTGVTAEQATGARLAEVVRLLDEEGVPIDGRGLRAGARPTTWAGRVRGKEGDTPVAVSSGALLGPPGEPPGTVLVLRDMRREHEVEQMKSDFLSRIGHELRTPLTGILGYADILRHRRVPEEQARIWHDEILHSGRRLLRIVEMLEFIASEGAGRVVLQVEPVDISDLVNAMASDWSERLPPNLTLDRHLPAGEVWITADGRWLTMAVDELIDNAVKFSPEGGRILIEVRPGAETVQLSVSDQGTGMTARHHDELFSQFVQGDTSDTRRFGGLGLGLAVVRRVVEGHGGLVTCRSEPGRGTTVTIELRAVRHRPGSDGSARAERPVRRRASPTAEGDGS